MSEEKKGIPLRQTKAAKAWSILMYILSAISAAEVLAELDGGSIPEALNSLGLTLIFVGLYFRSSEVAAIAYISAEENREKALSKLREIEKTARPWLSPMIRCGWILMFAGIGMQLLD